MLNRGRGRRGPYQARLWVRVSVGSAACPAETLNVAELSVGGRDSTDDQQDRWEQYQKH
jgi:hypothetical protein